jgi:hypothetical protein
MLALTQLSQLSRSDNKMPLIQGKSEKSFKKNLETEMNAGKPQKQSLAIAYSMKRKAQRKKMADGGAATPAPSPSPTGYENAGKSLATDSDSAKAFTKGLQAAFADGGPVDPIKDSRLQSKAHQCEMCGHTTSNEEHEHDRHDSMGEPMMAEGGQITDNYQSSSTAQHQTHMGDVDDQDTYVKDHQGNLVKKDKSAMSEDSRKLGQHGAHEEGPQGGDGGFHDESYMGNPGNSWDNYSESEDGDGQDMIGRIMKQRQQMFSEGGKVANINQGVSTDSGDELADLKGNEFDDLSLRDDLEQSYTGANSGDELDDARENKDRADIVSRIMRSRAKKDRMPRPA